MGKLGDLWDSIVDFFDGDDKKKSTTNTAKNNDKLLSQGQGPVTGNTKPIGTSVSGNMVPNTNKKNTGQKVTAAPANKQSDAVAANHASARKNYAEKNGVYNPATGTHQVKKDSGKKETFNVDIKPVFAKEGDTSFPKVSTVVKSHMLPNGLDIGKIGPVSRDKLNKRFEAAQDEKALKYLSWFYDDDRVDFDTYKPTENEKQLLARGRLVSEKLSSGMATVNNSLKMVNARNSEAYEKLYAQMAKSDDYVKRTIGEYGARRIAEYRKNVVLGILPETREEFYEGIPKKADFKEKSKFNPEKAPLITIGEGKRIYEYINAEDKDKAKYAYENEYAVYDEMTTQEKGTYNYLYNQYGKEEAAEYLSTIEEGLHRRAAQKTFDKIKGDRWRELSYVPYVGMNQAVTGLKNAFNTKDEYIPYNQGQILAGMISEDIPDGTAWQVAFDLGSTTFNMAPSIAAGIINPAAGAVMMGVSSAGNAYQDKLNSGEMDKSQARVYSSIIGFSEAGLSYFLGGIGKLGGKVTGNALSKIALGIDNAAAKFALQYGGKIASEALEESLQSVLEPMFENMVLGYMKNEDVDWGEVAYSGLLGALSAGLIEGRSVYRGTFGANAEAKRVGANIRKNGTIADVMSLAENSPAESDAHRLSVLYKDRGISQDNISDLQIGRLHQKTKENVRDVLSAKKSTVEEKTQALDKLARLNEFSQLKMTSERKRDAFDEIVDMKPTADEVYYFIDEKFEESYDSWVSNGKRDGVVLTVGRTSEALKSIGVKEQSVTWDTSNINRSLRSHPYLNDTIMKQIPYLVENPIIVMQSKKSDSRITMFGEVYDVDGVPIMAVLELLPTNLKGNAVLDVIKITSTHSRKSSNPNKLADMTQTQGMINTSDILYVEPDKKRTDNWLVANRLQLPLHITNYGSIKSVTYPDGNVNTYDMQDAQNNNNNFDATNTPPKVADGSVGKTTGLTATDIESGNISDELKVRLENYKNVLSRLGFNITYVPNREIADNVIGYADITNREVYLSPEHIDDALMMHELTHVIDRGFNNGYIKSLVSFFKREFSEDWNKAIKKAEENYKNIPGANLEAEALADMCMRLAEDNYINMAESMDIKNLKQICLMFQYMVEKVKSVFSDDVTAHKLKMASLKWQLALRKAMSRGEASNRRGLLYVLTNQGVNVKAQDEYVEAVQMYEREFSGYKSGELPERGYYIIGKPSPVMEKYTNGTDEIIMDVDVVVKATGGKHSISMDEMSMLAEKMLDPLMIFKSDTVNNAYVVFVEMKNKNNVPVVVALHMDKKRGRLSVSNIASVHSRVDTDSGKDKTQNFINEQVRKGNFVYANEKSQSWFSTFGLQLPSVVQTFIDSNRIVSQDGENSNKNLSTNDDVSFAVATDDGSAGEVESVSAKVQEKPGNEERLAEIDDELSHIEKMLENEELPNSHISALLLSRSKLFDERDKLNGVDAKSIKSESKAPKHKATLDEYRETGNADVLPDKESIRASRRYGEKKIADLRKEFAQIQKLLRNEKSMPVFEREELYARRDTVQAQLKRVVENNLALEEMESIIDGFVTEEHVEHTWVQDISEELHDNDGIIRKGKYLLNDVERNFRNFFGKHYKKAYDAIIQPLWDSKKRYTEGVKGYADKLNDEVVKKLGIKKDSKMSAAVMWLGEGQRPATKGELVKAYGKAKAEKLMSEAEAKGNSEVFIPYTYEDCRNEFGADRANKILEASEVFRSMYDELIDSVNETRAKIYPNNPDKLVKKRKDYFHHFQDMGQGFAGLRNILNANHDIDPMLVGTSEHTQPKSKFQGFMQRRLGVRTDYDAVEGFLKYLPAAMYSIHIDPNIVNVRSLARELALAKASENDGVGNSNANRFIEYLQKYANSLAGKTVSQFDRGVIGLVGRTPIAVISWLNNKTKASAVLGNLNSVLSQVTNIKNVIGKIEHQSDVVRGALETLAGLNPNSEARERYKESGFLKERYMDKVFSQFDSNWQKINPVKWAADILGFADEIGTRITWNAAYNEALRKGVDNPVQYADNFTRASVAGRGIGEEALVFKSQLAKMFLPFRTEVLNDLRVQQDILFGEEYEVFGDGKKVKTNAGKRIKNIMQLYVASMVVNAFIAAIKSDEFDPIEEAEEGYEEKGVLGALISVMEDYADGIGDPVAFDPIYDMVSGIYQGISEGESVGGDIGMASARALQNLAGDAVSNNPFSTAIMGMMGFDNDVADLLFNGNVYVPGGMGMPLASNMATVMREVGQGDWGAAGAAAIKPFLPLGTQADRTFKGMYEWAKGYSTTESAYDRIAGQEGDLKYLIEKNPENFIKSLLFGPGAFSAESDAYFNGQQFSEEEQAEILAHDDYEGRKTEFDKILEWHDYEAYVKEQTEAVGEEYYKDKVGSALYELYMSEDTNKKKAVPYKKFYETMWLEFEDVKYIHNSTPERAKVMGYEYGERMKDWFAELNDDEVFKGMSVEERGKFISGIATLEEKYVKAEELHRMGRMPEKEYVEFMADYEEKIAKKVEELKSYELTKLEDEAKSALAFADAYGLSGEDAYVDWNAADTAGQYMYYYDGKMSKEAYNGVLKFANELSARDADSVDRELARLSGATGSKINVSGNAYGVVSYTKKKVEYKIDIPDSEVYNLCSTVDREVRSGLKSLFDSSSYKSASAEAQKEMVADVKRKIRGKIKAVYKAKYPSIRVDSILNGEKKVSNKVSDLFDEIINMK